jgi:hypothetical protein
MTARTLALAAVGIAVLAPTTGGAQAGAGREVSLVANAPRRVDYELAFVEAFPVSGNEHRITNWTLYSALVTGDLVTYGEMVDPSIAKRADGAKGKPYQTQQVEMTIKGDARLVAAFNDQRRRIRAMVLYVDGDGFAGQKCQHPLTYVENEFRLVLGESGDGADPLSHATIAPSCPSSLQPGFQITAARSSRFKCWPSEYVTRCGWALPDMPAALKGVVENDYPASLALRWRWRGLGDVVHTRYVDANGNRVTIQHGVAVTVPDELSLEFVGADGHVLWTASAATPVHKAAPARGR